MKASFLALLCVSVLVVTDAAAEINAATSFRAAACPTTTVSAAADDTSAGWLKRKKRRPAYRRLRAHRR